MYELNSSFTVLDESDFESNRERALETLRSAGAQDVLLGQIMSGAGAGTRVWSTRWQTADEAIAFTRQMVASTTKPSNSQLANRSLNQVINEVGERAGPCLAVAITSSAKPTPHDENLHVLETFVANGGKGASTVVALHGDYIGCLLTAFYSDSFQQNADAQMAIALDSRVRAMAAEYGVTTVERIFIDII